jgi:hypothetical protein
MFEHVSFTKRKMCGSEAQVMSQKWKSLTVFSSRSVFVHFCALIDQMPKKIEEALLYR